MPTREPERSRGELDPAKLFGREDDVRAGYPEVRITLSIDADTDEESLQERIDEVEERCPVTDNLTNTTPAGVSIADA